LRTLAVPLLVATLLGATAANSASADPAPARTNPVAHAAIGHDGGNAAQSHGPVASFRPGSALNDDSGHALQAHGSDVVQIGHRWYWYGSAPRQTDNTLPFAAFGGINVYSSSNLNDWHYEGMAVAPRASGTLSNQLVAYNPRVLYNAHAKKYVMVLSECCGDGSHGDLETGHLVFMTSDTPAGPFTFVHDEWPGDISVYDMGTFQDDDGTAYVVYSDGNQGTSIERLSSDYLTVAQRVAHFSSGRCEEAPAIAKHDGTYFLTDSYCAGWSANQGHYRAAPSIAGPWHTQPDGNLGDTTTYNTQAFDILPVHGSAGTTYVWIGDRWNCPQSKCDLTASTYGWLPLVITGSKMSLRWANSWRLNLATGSWSADPAYSVLTSQVPEQQDLTDGRSYELGTKIESRTAGRITTIRYYRAPSETGTHTGQLWSSSGRLLATARFRDESRAGWQVATLSHPVTVRANTVYVASVGVNAHYTATVNGFTKSVGDGPLTAVADGANGVFGDLGRFPTTSYNNSNYFVDVRFTPRMLRQHRS
jgi:hypothetical protein